MAHIVVRFPISIVAALVAASPLSVARTAENSPDPPADFEFETELPESDRDAITLDVMSRYPVLAASPGIKYARGSRRYPTGESAHVIFYPHAETRGVKHAFQVQCERSERAGEWSCPSVEVRRYVRLDTQDFEVRVVGDIDLDGVLALTDATRDLATTALPDAVVDTVTIIHEINGSYLVGWSSSTWREGVSVQATLKPGGNAADAADWNAFLLDENGDRAE